MIKDRKTAAEYSQREIDRLLTKVLFQGAEIDALKRQRKEMRAQITARRERAVRNTKCPHCEEMKRRLQQVAAETKSKNSIGKILRRWYPEDYPLSANAALTEKRTLQTGHKRR